MKKPARYWSTKQDEKIYALFNGGKTLDQIALIFDTNRYAIYGRVRAMRNRLNPRHEGAIERKCLNCDKTYRTDSPYLRLCPTHRSA